MSDVFISYAKEDRSRAAKLAEALATTGMSVFWDRTLPAGLTWRDFIGEELKVARCIIVVWTGASVQSDWVLEEAEIGRKRGILVPVLLEAVEVPLGFGAIHAADLTEWDGTATSSELQKLIRDMERLLGSVSDQRDETDQSEAVTVPNAERLQPTSPPDPVGETLEEQRGSMLKSWFLVHPVVAIATVALIIISLLSIYSKLFVRWADVSEVASVETTQIDVSKSTQTFPTDAVKKDQILASRPEARYGIPDADQYLVNDTYIAGYSYRNRQPRWALELLEPDKLRDEVQIVDRMDNFREDLRIPEEFRSTLEDYRGSGYDRGHLISSANWRQRAFSNSQIFLLSNITPQSPHFNRKIWRDLEIAVRSLAKNGEYLAVYVISGPLFSINGRPAEFIGKNRVAVPHSFFKSILAENRRGQLHLWSFSIPNETENKPLTDYLVPTSEIERQSGLLLWSQLRGSFVKKLRQQVRPMWEF